MAVFGDVHGPFLGFSFWQLVCQFDLVDRNFVVFAFIYVLWINQVLPIIFSKLYYSEMAFRLSPFYELLCKYHKTSKDELYMGEITKIVIIKIFLLFYLKESKCYIHGPLGLWSVLACANAQVCNKLNYHWIIVLFIIIT